MTASGIVPWSRQLDLMDQWLEIISQELGLRGQYLDAEGAIHLAAKAAALQARAEILFKSLTDIASDGGG
jgi:hypothetical protein